MATTSIQHWSENHRPHLWILLVFNILLAVQLFAAVLYGLYFESPPTSLHLFLIPFVWTTVSILAVYFTDPVSRGWKHRLFASGIAGGYFLLFLALSGSIGLTPSLFDPVTNALGIGFGFDRTLGWGPILFYAGEWVGVRIIPFQLVGYLALSYLVYAAVLDVTKSASAGLLGFALCPGCAAAFFAPAFAGVAGLSSAFALFIRYSYEIATVLFVVAVAVLYWQPSVRTLRETGEQYLFEITGAFAVAVAGIHLFHPTHGIMRLVLYLQIGTIFDPRPVAFTLSAFAVFFGILLVVADVARKPVYLLGMALMLVFLLGYGAWHAFLDHGAFWPYIESSGHTDESILESIASHLFTDGRALLSKLLESVLFVLLALCYRRESVR